MGPLGTSDQDRQILAGEIFQHSMTEETDDKNDSLQSALTQLKYPAHTSNARGSAASEWPVSHDGSRHVSLKRNAQ